MKLNSGEPGVAAFAMEPVRLALFTAVTVGGLEVFYTPPAWGQSAGLGSTDANGVAGLYSDSGGGSLTAHAASRGARVNERGLSW